MSNLNSTGMFEQMNEKPNDGGPAFPCPVEFDPNQQLISRGTFGMSLRDWFARETPADEIQAFTFKHLSRMAQERLAGMTMPVRNANATGNEAVDYQIAIMRFEAAVNAALRYISADAMLAARDGKKEENQKETCN